jgi:hypothetical protein
MALTDTLAAVAVGVAFGFALERGGLGSARKLTGQFFLTDLTVFKVMFSAIVTAMLGTFWLGRLGVMDLAFLYVPDTYLPAQVVGGAIFGAGFALAGLCPGTSCVAAASGRADGAMVVAGMFAGVFATGLGFPLIERLYVSGARGAWTLPQLLHLPYGVVVFLVVLMALAGFAAAEWIEAWPRSAIRISSRSTRIVWLAIAVLALGAAAAGRPTPRKVVAGSAPAAPSPVKPGNGC